MKESKYNVCVEHNGQHLMFNSRTTATAALDKPARDILDAVRQGAEVEETELVKAMEKAGFLVDDFINELQQLEVRYNLGRYEKSGLDLIVAPTMACNFSCPYCYESAKSGIMSVEIQDKIISMAEDFARSGQKIKITWFGGEPLLAKEVIYRTSERLIEICEKNKVEYEATIITNGYLLDEATVRKLKEYRVSEAQITLDGLPATHNQKRRLKNNTGDPTFDQIVENIILAKKHGIAPAIRINIDKQTQTELKQLVELMIEKGLGEDLYLGYLEGNTDSCKGYAANCLSHEEFAKTYVDYEKLLLAKNLKPGYPLLHHTYCGADYLYSYVIEPNGNMYKCWNEVGIDKYRIGNIGTCEDYEQFIRNPNVNYAKFLTWSPFNFEKCRECSFLPICTGGCQYNGQRAGEPVCDRWKYVLGDYIKLTCDAS
ncbi:radical SAM protein [Anoxybacterium hadale]|uniref:Radical SAM protein n=1 Tax=Anoxybacterium hadale TaxID=3408580 RepID=A0ACD1AF63_9FIRM|nr:radical SAM protein [Clostridiales bacterium]